MRTLGLRFPELISDFLHENAGSEWHGLTDRDQRRILKVGAKFEAITEYNRSGDRFWGFEVLASGPQETGFPKLAREFSGPPASRLFRAALLLAQLESIFVFRQRAATILGVENLRFTVNLDAHLLDPDESILRNILGSYSDRLSDYTYLEISETMPPKKVDRLALILSSFHFGAILDDVTPDTPSDFRRSNLLRHAFAVKVDATHLEAALKDAVAVGGLDSLAELVPAGLRLIVEGVEGPDQQDMLRFNWDDRLPQMFWQGYGIHPPAPWKHYLIGLAEKHPCGYGIRPTLRRRRRSKTVPERSPNAALVNGYKLFYSRINRGLTHRQLGKMAGVDARVINNLEQVGKRKPPACFGSLERSDLAKLEGALGCVGGLEWGQHDDLLARYLMFYNVNHISGSKALSSNAPLDFVPETRAVVFDFGGTLTTPKHRFSTWERMWLGVGFTTRDAGDLLKAFRANQITHQEWCDRTSARLRERGFGRAHMDAIIRDIEPVSGLRETFETLSEKGIRIFIVSGSVGEIIEAILGDARGHVEDIMANHFEWDADGIVSGITGHQYDFEGKATFIRKVTITSATK